MSTTQTASSQITEWAPNEIPSASFLGRRVRVLGGVQDGREGAIIKVNRRTIRVALDSRPGDPADITETMIGHPQFFEVLA